MRCSSLLASSLQCMFVVLALSITGSAAASKIISQKPDVCVDGDVMFASASGDEPSQVSPSDTRRYLPWVYGSSNWYPICGHWLWDNHNAATTFCQKLGFETGKVITGDVSVKAVGPKPGAKLTKDAMPVGLCKAGEDLSSCTGGGNTFGNFDKVRDGYCTKGTDAWVRFECSGGSEFRQKSCVVPIKESDGCYKVKDRSECCGHTDGRSNVYGGEACISSASGKTFSSGNICEPECWTKGGCGPPHDDESSYVGTCPIKKTDGCYMVKDRKACCGHTDGRSNVYGGEACISSASGETFTSGNVCEPECWTKGLCGPPHDDESRLIGYCQQVPSGMPVELSDDFKASSCGKVVVLLHTMRTQIESDGKAEQQSVDKYACWCETTTTQQAAHIAAAGQDLRALGQRILKLKGKVATRTAEIEELATKFQRNVALQEELTALRQKENAAWAAESSETKQALAALQQAISILAGVTTPGNAAFLQENARLRSQGVVKTVLQKLPSAVGVPDQTLALLDEFTSAKTGYAPQSATIQGLLADMYLTFSEDLESSTLDEANKNSHYEELYASVEDEDNHLKAMRENKESEKADAESMLADTTKTYDDTENQMKADTDFFDSAKAACESKHDEWSVRNKMRTEELEGIDRALAILTSDAARKLFAKTEKRGAQTFLQISSTPALLQDSASVPAAKAYKALRNQVRKSHSFRLAAIAIKVRMAKAGHFDEVIKAIDGMVKTLQDEGAADIAKREQCKDENHQIDRRVSKLDWKIENNEAKIDKLEKLIELRNKELDETKQRIRDTAQYMSDLDDERKAENDAFSQSKRDDRGAISLLESAKAMFAEFYKKQGVEMGDIQGSPNFLQGEPEFERSKDDAPDASLSNKGSRKNQSKNILSLLSYIIEDLNDEIANGQKAEAQSQVEYEEETAIANGLLKDLKAKVVTLNEIIAKRNSGKEEENKVKKNNNADKDSEVTYKGEIQPDCDWIFGAFETRATARAAEVNGLTSAKEFLAGQASLLEKSGKEKFDDAVFSRIGFLAMH